MERREFIKAGAAALAVYPLISIAQSPIASQDKVNIPSPGGRLEAAFYPDRSGRLCYQLLCKGNKLIEDSPLGITVDGVDLGSGVNIQQPVEITTINENSPTRGNHPVAQDHFRSASIPISAKHGKPWILQARVYDDGLAWRYVVPTSGGHTITGEATSFKLPAGSIAFYQQNMRNYEGNFQRSSVENVKGILGLPVTFRLAGDQGYMAITEAALYSYSGMALETSLGRNFRAVFTDDDSWQVEADKNSAINSPWRVVMAVPMLSDLVNCDIIHNVSPRPSPELFSDADQWIRPGRALWSWWSEGTGGLQLQKKYVDAASKLGFEYILVDEGWEFWIKLGKARWGVLSELVDYAKARGVKVWVWKRWGKLDDKNYRNDFFRKVREAGVVGVKIDFMDNESKQRIEFYESALEDAARHKLMVNFHGANKPAGESSTYPNEMTREGVRGLEYNRLGPTLTPEYNATLPFTRFIAGHGDYTPTTFNPKKLGLTSYAHQLAMPVVFLSPLTHYADKPENYLDNPASAPALDVLKSIPTVWDRTIVLNGSSIGECAAFARRNGQDWFIGIINGEQPRTLEIELSFLDRIKYKAVILADLMETQAGFDREEKDVTAKDTLEAKMRAGGGFVAMLKPE